MHHISMSWMIFIVKLNSKGVSFLIFFNLRSSSVAEIRFKISGPYSKSRKNESHRRQKSLLQKLSEMIQVTVPNFFYFAEISKMSELEPKNVDFSVISGNALKIHVFASSSLIFEILAK